MSKAFVDDERPGCRRKDLQALQKLEDRIAFVRRQSFQRLALLKCLSAMSHNPPSPPGPLYTQPCFVNGRAATGQVTHRFWRNTRSPLRTACAASRSLGMTCPGTAIVA